jgi:fructokinase
MAQRFTVVGLGEALFDIYPDKHVLGGAPLNVAVHAHQLGAAIAASGGAPGVGGGERGQGPHLSEPRPWSPTSSPTKEIQSAGAPGFGGRGVVVSRIGQDELGQTLLAELTGRGMTTDFIQTDPDRDTGKVYIGTDDRGEPTFEIARDVAWDTMQWDPDLEGLARQCEAVCYGTLAQRDGQSRTTIYRFLDAATRAIRLYDVNLRQTFFDQRIVRKSFEYATVAKLNLEELAAVADLLSLDVGPDGEGRVERTAAALLRKFKLRFVAVTRGPEGTVLYSPTAKVEGEAVSYPPAPDADSVGAGDACAAGLLVGMLRRWPAERTVALANHLGAFVASQPGATPPLPEAILAMVR